MEAMTNYYYGIHILWTIISVAIIILGVVICKAAYELDLEESLRSQVYKERYGPMFLFGLSVIIVALPILIFNISEIICISNAPDYYLKRWKIETQVEAEIKDY